MLELLKKIGIPATVSAVIAALVTTVPLLFKIDERYAKDDDVQALSTRTERAINELTVEISKLSGTQETIVTMMAAQEARRAIRNDLIVPVQPPAASPAPVIVGAVPKPAASSPTVKFDEVSRTLREQQSRLQALKY